MTVFIDALSVKTGGGLTYIHNILRHMPKSSGTCRIVVFAAERVMNAISDGAQPGIQYISVRVRTVIGRLLYENLIMPLILASAKNGVLFAPADIAPLWCPCRLVLGIQNLKIYELTREGSMSARAKRAVQRFLARAASRQAEVIILQSQFAAQKVSTVLGFGTEKVVIIPHGADGPREERMPNRGQAHGEQLSDLPDSVLCVANMARHKNIETLLQAYSLLDCELRERHCLVIVGHSNTRYLGELVDYCARLGISDRVRFTGWIPNELLGAYYRSAAVFVLPSLVETFGIPIVEAMACGVPTIASNASSIPEIVGDAGILVDPLDAQGFAEAISRVLTIPRLRRQLIQQGLQRTRDLTWESSAGRLLEVLCREH